MKENKRPQIITLRLASKDKYETWKEVAAKEERSVSGWIKKVCNDAVQKVKPSDKL